VRKRHEECELPFVLVHVSTPLRVCEARDPKGHYARARRGDLDHFTGVSDPYEPPLKPEVVVDSSKETVAESIDKIISKLRELGYVDDSRAQVA
jgi:adenylylsulfate kinase